jgi:hypothetical protein
MNKEQQDLLDEAYENYNKEIIRQREIQKEQVTRLRSQGKLVNLILDMDLYQTNHNIIQR